MDDEDLLADNTCVGMGVQFRARVIFVVELCECRDCAYCMDLSGLLPHRMTGQGGVCSVASTFLHREFFLRGRVQLLLFRGTLIRKLLRQGLDNSCEFLMVSFACWLAA